MSTKKKTHKLTLEFDNKEAAANFVANWLDGGGDGGGNLDWDTTKWDKKSTKMRIKGTGKEAGSCPYCSDCDNRGDDCESYRR